MLFFWMNMFALPLITELFKSGFAYNMHPLFLSLELQLVLDYGYVLWAIIIGFYVLELV